MKLSKKLKLGSILRCSHGSGDWEVVEVFASTSEENVYRLKLTNVSAECFTYTSDRTYERAGLVPVKKTTKKQ